MVTRKIIEQARSSGYTKYIAKKLVLAQIPNLINIEIFRTKIFKCFSYGPLKRGQSQKYWNFEVLNRIILCGEDAQNVPKYGISYRQSKQ